MTARRPRFGGLSSVTFYWKAIFGRWRSGSFSGDEMVKAIASICNIVRLIEILLFELEAVSEMGAVGLEEMRRAFSQWAQFAHPPEYLPAREAERAILLRFASAPGLDAVDALGQLDQERLMHDLDGREDEPRKRLYHDILSVLEKRATDVFIGRLGEENAVASVGSWSQAGRFLIRGGGLLWNVASRVQLRKALEGDKSPARSDNATDLLGACCDLKARDAGNGSVDAPIDRDRIGPGRGGAVSTGKRTSCGAPGGAIG